MLLLWSQRYSPALWSSPKRVALQGIAQHALNYCIVAPVAARSRLPADAAELFGRYTCVLLYFLFTILRTYLLHETVY